MFVVNSFVTQLNGQGYRSIDYNIVFTLKLLLLIISLTKILFPLHFVNVISY